MTEARNIATPLVINEQFKIIGRGRWCVVYAPAPLEARWAVAFRTRWGARRFIRKLSEPSASRSAIVLRADLEGRLG